VTRKALALAPLLLVLLGLGMVPLAAAEDGYIKIVFNGDRPDSENFVNYYVEPGNGAGSDGGGCCRVFYGKGMEFSKWFSVPLREYGLNNPMYLMSKYDGTRGAALRVFIGKGGGGACYRWVLLLHLEATITGIWFEHTRYKIGEPAEAGSYPRDVLIIGYHGSTQEPLLASSTAPHLVFKWGDREVAFKIANTPSNEYYVYTVTYCSSEPVHIDFVHINETLHIADLVPPRSSTARPAASLPSNNAPLVAVAAAGAFALMLVVLAWRR
jgi:hypothetical protein